MRKLFLIVFFSGSIAVSGQSPDSTLPKVDSFAVAQQYLANHPVQPVVQENSTSLGQEIFIIAVLALLSLCAVIASYLLLQKRKSLNKPATLPARMILEKKINDLNSELVKISKENDGLNRVIKEYNGIQHDFESLRHGLNKTFKVRYYPGSDKKKNAAGQLQGMLDTEAAVANYAYEKFLKPIMSITDANKNHPAKISRSDEKKLLELLLSLAFLYTEYLYLRVGELSIGGNMVERISQLRQNKNVDRELLKKLDMENGSRALVIKLLLDKYGIHPLSYPVFDETDLNNQ